MHLYLMSFSPVVRLPLQRGIIIHPHPLHLHGGLARAPAPAAPHARPHGVNAVPALGPMNIICA